MLFLSGNGKTSIAKILNARGVPNPTEYKRIKGYQYKTPHHKIGTLWKHYAIAKMLQNEMYIGTMVQGKYGSVSYKTGENKPRPREQWIRVENTHEPIIEMDLWDRVQVMLEEKAKPWGTGEIGLFSRKAKCLYCGYTMRASKHVTGRRYLKCSTKHVATDTCPGGFIGIIELEQSVLAELRKLLSDSLDHGIVEQNVVLHNNYDEQIRMHQSEILTSEKRIEDYNKAVVDSYMDKSKDLITESQFIEISKSFSEDKERLEKHVAAIREDVNRLIAKRSKVRDRRSVVLEYTNIDKLDRVMAERLIDHIKVGKRVNKKEKVPIEIHWYF